MNDRRTIFENEVSRWLKPGGVVESLCGNRRVRSGVIQPGKVEDVQRILFAASKAAGMVKIQPISCGRNWGFGSDLATEDGVYTLDLSGLDSDPIAGFGKPLCRVGAWSYTGSTLRSLKPARE